MKNLFILILGFFNLKARYTSAQVALLQQQLAERNKRITYLHIQLNDKTKQNNVLFNKLIKILHLTWTWSKKIEHLKSSQRFSEAQGFSKAGSEVRAMIDPDLIGYDGYHKSQKQLDDFLIERGIKKDLDRTA